ncbi:hypothetical protein CAPTEDRAFT_201557 [Capitella teleta]|uniref:Uncharacterized protein n=1 Tax=Capitella teleta TaxID=283909 RepID=R7U9C0_CAPTE|nr:hypothetical protein CAPTEDRAFT_201557 [Capitella teleta]|eukprot:ELU02741.1 hypothetical protein CAPTEDRAFT_201557 [Capitella teleta]
MILSPDDSGVVPVQHRNLIYGRPPQMMMQQHQGQNPTVARNTHKHSDEELSVQGNCLVPRGAAVPSNINSDDLISAFADTWENSLLPNELTRAPLAEAVRPKQPNVPKFNFKRKNGFMSLFKRHKNAAGAAQKEQLMSNYSDEVGKSNLAPRGTEVCIVNGAPIVRPTTLNVDAPDLALTRSLSQENVTTLKTPVTTETAAMSTEDWRLESQQRNLFHPETSSSNASFALLLMIEGSNYLVLP